MLTHLENHHREEHRKLIGKDKNQTELINNNKDSPQSNGTTSKLTTLLMSNKPLSKGKIDRLIADVIINDMQPYSKVEDKGFTSLLKAAL